MKPKIGREIALLCLPVLLFGGAALWKTLVPGGLNEPPRLRQGVACVESEPLRAVAATPAEVARGLTAKLETTLWDGGDFSQWPRRLSTYGLYQAQDQNLRLIFQQNGRWKTYVAPDGTSGVRLRINNVEWQKPAAKRYGRDWNAQIWLPLAALPSDASAVHLKGQWTARWIGSKNMGALTEKAVWRNGAWRWRASSRAFDVDLNTIRGLEARAGVIPDVSRAQAVKLVKIEALPLPQGENNHSVSSATGDAAINLDVSAPKGGWRWKNNYPRVLEYRLFDAAGRDWTNPSEGLQASEWRLDSGGTTSGGARPAGQFSMEGHIALGHIPPQAGRIRAKIWISDESQSWPLVVEHEVRPKWLFERTSRLQIESARIIKTPEVFDPVDNSDNPVKKGEMRHRIQVVVRYGGKGQAVPRGFLQNHVVTPTIDYWEWQPRSSYSSASSWGGGGQPMPVAPGDADLLVHWSQQVFTARGTLVKTKKSGRWDGVIGPPRKPIKLDSEGKRWAVRYDLDQLPPLKPNEKYSFRAQIGIAGEGFVPVEVPLSRAALR